MDPNRPVFIPVLLGTPRKGRMSEHVARVVHEQVSSWPGVESELIDIRTIPIAADDEGEDLKDPKFSATLLRADGLVIVSPEYNHGYSGTLKRVLDTCLKEYIHKAVGVVGVSAGPWGGARGIQGLLPVLRELGLVTIFWDVQFAGVHKVFDDSGKLLDPAYLKRIDKFIAELVWMARTLRHGREHVTLEQR